MNTSTRVTIGDLRSLKHGLIDRVETTGDGRLALVHVRGVLPEGDAGREISYVYCLVMIIGLLGVTIDIDGDWTGEVDAIASGHMIPDPAADDLLFKDGAHTTLRFVSGVGSIELRGREILLQVLSHSPLSEQEKRAIGKK